MVDSPELDRLFLGVSSEVEVFRRDQPEIWEMVNAVYMVAGIAIASAQACVMRTRDVHRAMMWATLLDYQMDSLFLILRRRLDTGLALLRMSSELARDVARICEIDANFDIWLERQADSSRSQYRRIFRFNDTNEIEGFVHKLYDLSSTLGVHGHLTAYVSVHRERQSHDVGLVSLKVSDIDVLKVLEIWLAAAFPLHSMCIDTFQRTADDRFTEARQNFDHMWKLFDAWFLEYRARLARVQADVLGTMH